MPPEPLASTSLTVVADYGQIYIYDPAIGEQAQADNVYTDALADAIGSRRFVGTAEGLIDLLTPGQYNFRTPMLVEVWRHEPEDDRDGWDHEVDLDLDIPSGVLVFAASGGGASTTADVPSGRYRARVSGRGFTAIGHAGANGQDSYRLRLWPRTDTSPAVLRKRWPGWDGYR